MAHSGTSFIDNVTPEKTRSTSGNADKTECQSADKEPKHFTKATEMFMCAKTEKKDIFIS